MLKQFRKIKKGEFFVVGCDCSMGCGDYSVAQFASKNWLDVPLEWSSKSSATEMTTQIYPVLEQLYESTGVRPLVAYERNNGGVFEMERLAALNRLDKFEIFRRTEKDLDDGTINVSNKLGWDTNSATRPAMLETLKDAIDNKLLRLYDRVTVGELLSFVNIRTSTAWKAQAEKNSHDDHVMALAIAWKLIEMSESVEERKGKTGNEALERYNQRLNQIEASKTGY